jgi:aminoglycoside phosphotransferase (APT) family kinase protein
MLKDSIWQGASLSALLRQVFGASTRIAELQTVKDEPDYRVLIAQLDAPALRVVVKLAGEHPPYPCPFERTAALYRLVAWQTEIPMPEIYAVGGMGRDWPGRYMIKTYLEGVEWAQLLPVVSLDERDALLAQLGRAVAQLHAISFPAYGEIAADGTLPGGGSPLLEALASRARTWIRDPELLVFFLAILDAHIGLFREETPASLTHEDLHKHNILFSKQAGGWRLATLLDFDKAWAGPAESDLARLDLWRGMSGPSFWQAYQELRPISPAFTQRRRIYQLLWCLEYAAPTPLHLADTQAVCQALGVELPKEFK